MTDKTKLIIIYSGVGFVLLLIIIAVIIKSNSTKSTISPSLTPFPTDNAPTITPYKIPITIVMTPKDKQENVPVDSSITFTFPSIVNIQNVSFITNPAFNYDLNKQGIHATIIPKSLLNPGTVYTITVSYIDDQGLKQFQNSSFTTLGPTITPDSFSNSNSVVKNENNYERTNHPDTYLFGICPHTENTFTLTCDNPSPGVFTFTVTSSIDITSGKNDFIKWATNSPVNLTETQLQSLTITYK